MIITPTDVKRPICLAAIVKNEENTLPRMFASFEGYVTHWAIVDTGSTDNTLAILETAVGNRPNFRYIQRPWVNYGHGRTESLELARETLAETGDLERGYILVVDADETIQGPPLALDYGPVDIEMFFINHRDASGTQNILPTILKASHPFFYDKPIHECVACRCKTTQHTSAFLENNRVACNPDSIRGRMSKTERLNQVIDLLKPEIVKNPDDPHANFYLAQSYLGLEDYDAALSYYTKRERIDTGCREHQWYSCYIAAAILEEVRREYGEAEAQYLKAWAMRPHRVDPLVALIRMMLKQGRVDNAYYLAKTAARIPTPTSETCFIIPGMHDWIIREELAICAAAIGLADESSEIFRSLIEQGRAPEADLKRYREYLAEIEAVNEQGLRNIPDSGGPEIAETTFDPESGR